jgi:hypothetical protein
MSNSNVIILEGAAGGRDENQISTCTVPYLARTAAEIGTVGRGSYMGLVESTRSWQAINDGSDGYIVNVTYKGYLEDEEEPQPEDTEQWSLNFDFSEEPIESHPKFADIRKRYGGYREDAAGPILFPEVMPQGASSSSGLGGKGKLKAGDRNPMHGTSSYAVMTARVTRSWSSKNIPKGAVNDIGKVFNTIPNAPETITKVDFGSRNWMQMPPKITQNGDVWRIEDEWLLSPSTGWIEEVYEKASKQ